MNHRVLEVMFKKYKFQEHCNALKRYLLLGQGDFIAYLMRLLGYTHMTAEREQRKKDRGERRREGDKERRGEKRAGEKKRGRGKKQRKEKERIQLERQRVRPCLLSAPNSLSLFFFSEMTLIKLARYYFGTTLLVHLKVQFEEATLSMMIKIF